MSPAIATPTAMPAFAPVDKPVTASVVVTGEAVEVDVGIVEVLVGTGCGLKEAVLVRLLVGLLVENSDRSREAYSMYNA